MSGAEPMSGFSDDDLKLLKYDMAEILYRSGEYIPNKGILEALLARLEGSESLLDRAMRRLQLINGDESKCCMNPDSCMNHSLIREYETWRKSKGE